MNPAELPPVPPGFWFVSGVVVGVFFGLLLAWLAVDQRSHYSPPAGEVDADRPKVPAGLKSPYSRTTLPYRPPAATGHQSARILAFPAPLDPSA